MVLKTIGLTIVGYLLTLALSRVLGRKLISQMTFFDFVLGVAIGSALVNASNPDSSVSGFTILLVIFTLTLIIDLTHIKSMSFRKNVESEPIVVIENGKIVEQNMKKMRLSVEELMMKLREKNAFNIGDVEFAIMEFDGNFSVQPKSQKQPLTPSDLKIHTPYKGLTRDLIVDGKVLDENLKFINLDEQWLKQQIRGYGIENTAEVFYAGLDTTGNLYVSKKNKREEVRGKYGVE